MYLPAPIESNDTNVANQVANESGAEPIWHEIQQCHARTVAVMGMSKNTGKTVTLNHLLALAARNHEVLGLTSIGRDGEERDEVFSVPKPPVKVPEGALIATAIGTLRRTKVPTRLMGQTDIASPMGSIVVVKALASGEMEVAGPSMAADQQRVLTLLQQCGCERIFLDGALGRSQHASPAMADGVVLATGAALGGGMADVLRKTHERLQLLALPEMDADLSDLSHVVFAMGGVGAWDVDRKPILIETIPSINAAKRLLTCLDSGIRYLAVTGAVGYLLWRGIEQLALRNPQLTVLVQDGTKLFVDAATLQAFQRRGGRIRALRAIRVLGVTVNPFTPYGSGFDADEFLAQAKESLSDQVVTDVCMPSHPGDEP